VSPPVPAATTLVTPPQTAESPAATAQPSEPAVPVQPAPAPAPAPAATPSPESAEAHGHVAAAGGPSVPATVQPPASTAAAATVDVAAVPTQSPPASTTTLPPASTTMEPSVQPLGPPTVHPPPGVETVPGPAAALASSVDRPLPTHTDSVALSSVSEGAAATPDAPQPDLSDAPSTAPAPSRIESVEPDLPALPQDDLEEDGDEVIDVIPAPAVLTSSAAAESGALQGVTEHKPVTTEAAPALLAVDTSTWSQLGDMSTNDSLLFDPNVSLGAPMPSVPRSPSRSSESSNGSRPDSPERDPGLVRAAREKIALARKSRQVGAPGDPELDELDEFVQLERMASLQDLEKPAFV
jgi:hypothetical protein